MMMVTETFRSHTYLKWKASRPNKIDGFEISVVPSVVLDFGRGFQNTDIENPHGLSIEVKNLEYQDRSPSERNVTMAHHKSNLVV